ADITGQARKARVEHQHAEHRGDGRLACCVLDRRTSPHGYRAWSGYSDGHPETNGEAKMMRRFLLATALFASGAVFAQTKWDLPAAYPATNFHTENLAQFAADVDKLTGGKLKITVHANASLFKANEIKRAVQGGQAQASEILMANFANESP